MAKLPNGSRRPCIQLRVPPSDSLVTICPTDYQPKTYSHQNGSQNNYYKKTPTQDDPAYSYKFPHHTALLQLALQTITSPKQPPNLPKTNDFNNQCSSSTHAVLSRQHWTVTNSPSPYRTTYAISYNTPQLYELLALQISVLSQRQQNWTSFKRLGV